VNVDGDHKTRTFLVNINVFDLLEKPFVIVQSDPNINYSLQAGCNPVPERAVGLLLSEK
jgi:hypothetical protein